MTMQKKDKRKYFAYIYVYKTFVSNISFIFSAALLSASINIIWPKAVAPFEAVVVPVNTNDEEVIKKADEIYECLLNMGVDVLIDDRNERAGVKFNDADLIGYPLRVSVGKKTLSDGKVEVLIRRTKEVILIDAP